MAKFKTTSSDHEDEFVHRLLTEENPTFKGTFLDIGCGNGRHSNNTYTLEEAGWTGVLVDEHKEYADHNAKFRKNRCVSANLSTADWADLLGIDTESVITADYISFRSQEAFRNFPWSTIRFRVMTLKHNSAEKGPAYRDETRRELLKRGYLLLAGDVCYDFCYQPFEDWYIDPAKVPASSYVKYMSNGVRGIDVIYKEKVPTGQKYITVSADLQDEFVHRLLGPKGRFLDIGCGHGIHGNNTFVLEKSGWTGEMIDLDKTAYEWNKVNRKCRSFCDDVTTCDWNAIIQKKPDEIVTYDYISFDVDEATIPAVKHFPWSTVRFRVITIEHDAYRVGNETRALIRETMAANGYMLLAADVCADFLYQPYEDWYIDPTLIDSDVYMPFISEGLRAAEVIYRPKL